MARLDCSIKIDLSYADELIAQLRPLVGNMHRVPVHLRNDVESLIEGPANPWLASEYASGVVWVRPTERLAALIGNLRAQGLI